MIRSIRTRAARSQAVLLFCVLGLVGVGSSAHAQPAHAQPAIGAPAQLTGAQPGTFTPGQPAGSDLTMVTGVTDGTCDAPGTPAAPVDSFNAVVTGPGVFAPNPEAGRPDGTMIVSTAADVSGFSTTDPIPFVFRSSFRDLARELGGPLLPGDYVVTFRCINQFDAAVYQRFSTTFTFAGGPPATAFTVTSPTAGTTAGPDGPVVSPGSDGSANSEDAAEPNTSPADPSAAVGNGDGNLTGDGSVLPGDAGPGSGGDPATGNGSVSAVDTPAGVSDAAVNPAAGTSMADEPDALLIGLWGVLAVVLFVGLTTVVIGRRRPRVRP